MKTHALLFSVMMALTGCASGGTDSDWPQWGGSADRNMVCSATDVRVDFSSGKYISEESDQIDLKTVRNAKWVAELGSQSYSTPMVADGRVYVGTNNANAKYQRVKGDRSLLLCLDQKTGKRLWQLTVAKLPGGQGAGDWEELGITASPAVEGKRAYIITSRGEVLCLDTAGLANGNDGPFTDELKYLNTASGRGKSRAGVQQTKLTQFDADILWRFDMRDTGAQGIGAVPDRTSYSHPLILGDYLYVNTSNGIIKAGDDGKSPASLIVLDKRTGKLLARDTAKIGLPVLKGNWSSPSFGVIDGHELIFFGGPDGFLYAFEAKPVKGQLKMVWRTDCNPVAYRSRPRLIKEVMGTPVFYEGRVYVAIGQDPEQEIQRGSLVCVNAANGATVWQYSRINSAMATAAIRGGRVYISDCYGYIYGIDAKTGKLIWRHDSLGHCWASPLWVDDKLIQGNNDAVLTVFDLRVLQQVIEKSRIQPLYTRASLGQKVSITTERGSPISNAPGLDLLPRAIKEFRMPGPMQASAVVANGVLYINAFTYLYAVEVGAGP